jgi:hypothetical protein
MLTKTILKRIEQMHIEEEWKLARVRGVVLGTCIHPSRGQIA